MLTLIGTFADISGLRPSQPRFWSQFFGLAWELAPTRMAVISALIVAIALVTTLQRHGKTALAWCFFASWLALMPTALAGHSAVSRDHMSSINALAIHLLAATTWVGGLGALVAMRHTLQPHLGVTARRFSTVAGWSYAALGLSGLLAAWFNLRAVGDLASAYGAMLLVKVGAFVLLGIAGYLHRRSALAALEASPTNARAFARLALGELVLMGVAIGNAWLTVWHADWLWIAVSLLAIGVYAAWFRRLRLRGDRWPWWQLICWVTGWLVFLYAMCGAPGVYGRILFSWHMTMHMTIAMLVPLLLVPAAPITLALRAIPARHDATRGPRELILALVHSRYLQVLANPVVAAVISRHGRAPPREPERSDHVRPPS